jgi:hypothetical protein
MSADFAKVLVKDDRLDVVDSIKYAVIKGGQNVTAAQYSAITSSNSQIVFNIQVPSEQTLIDRRILLQTDLSISVVSQQISATAAAPNVLARAAYTASGCGYGSTAALAPFPLHQLMTVASATINNNTVSINIRDVLPFIMRVINKEELQCYNGTTPSQQDAFYSYSDAYTSNLNSLSGFGIGPDSDINGRGSIALTKYARNVAGLVCTEDFTFHISEPIMLSPFLYSHPKSNGQAFYGIQNMNIVLNIGDLTRVFRGLSGMDAVVGSDTAATPLTYDVTKKFASPAGLVVPGDASYSLPIITAINPGNALGTANSNMFGNTRLLMTFLTPHPSDLMPARNIVPFYELPRYITTNLTAVAKTVPVVTGTNSIIPFTVTGGTQLTSQTLQLNQIPDKLVVMVRKSMGTQKWGDSESFLPIRKININFNNNSGILASAQCEDLYRMSKDNGSQQCWQEWVGLASGPYVTNATTGLAPVVPLSTAPTGFKTVPTVGGVLILEFGKDIQLVEDFFAPGSLGNFNIQMSVWVDNYQAQDFAGTGDLELVLVTMNSGVFCCERGTSSTYTGILTRADVLEASDQQAYTHSDVERLVGGGFMDKIKSGVQKLAPIAKVLAPIVAPHIEKYVKGKMGMGMSAGGPCGGGGSGGGGSGGALYGRYK